MTSCPPTVPENKHLLSEKPEPLLKGQAGQARDPETGLSPALSKGLCPSWMQKYGQAAPNSAPLWHITKWGL